MIYKLQKIPFKFQKHLPTIFLNVFFPFLNLTYIYTFILFRFNFILFFKLINSVRKKHFHLYTQNGFGDVFFSILLINFLKKKYTKFSFDLSIHYTDKTHDKNIISLKDNQKFTVYGDYISELENKLKDNIFTTYRGNCYNEAMLYTHIPFFRFIGYENIILQAPEVISHICSYNKTMNFSNSKYITFYFRNSSDRIYNIFLLFYKIFKNNGYDIVVFGENKTIIETNKNDIDIIDGDSYNFLDKIFIMSNPQISFTGRGGFALLPLFNNKHTFSFFDEQGVSEFNSGLWDFSMWRNNIIDSPIFPFDINYLDIINENIYELI